MIAIIKDLTIYGATFALTLLASYIAGQAKNKKNTPIFIIASLIAIAVPCILAGVRADTVGVDIKVYAKPVFSQVQVLSVTSLSETFEGVEVGYLFVAWLIAQFTNSLGVFLAVSQLLVVLPVYIVACRRNETTPIWITMLFYLCIFYCASFNLMRQCISGAILLLALQYYEEKRFVKAAILAFVAILFHNSTLIGIAIYLASYLINKSKKISSQLILMVLMSVVVAFLFVQWDTILNTAIQIGILPQKYVYYLTIFSGNHTTSQQFFFQLGLTNYIEMAFRVIFVIIPVACLRKGLTREKATYINAMFICVLVELLTMFVFHSSYGMRVTWNNEFILLMLLPSVASYHNISLRRTSGPALITFIVLLMYFVVGFVLFGWHGVKPFEFQ